MDPTALIAFLAPCLGFLLDTGRGVADRAASALGETVWEHARGLWACVFPAVDSRPAAREAAEDLAARPDDERARSALAWQLEKVLDGDGALAAEVARLWADAERAGAVVAGERGVAVGGNVTSSTIVTGDSNTVGRPQ